MATAPTTLPLTPWHEAFLALLPALRRQAQRSFRRLPYGDREEAVEAVVASAAVAYARLAEIGQTHRAFAGSLAKFGVRQYRAGRRVGSSACNRDVSSLGCQRQRGFFVSPLEEGRLADPRPADPAEQGALRIDLADWLASLSARNRAVACALARGATTGEAARRWGLTAGRVSQLRRELYESWRIFTGEHKCVDA